MKTINVDSHNVPATARSKNYQTALATTAASGGGATMPSAVAPIGGAADTAKVAQNLAEDSTDWAKILRKDIDERTENSLSVGKNLTVDGQAILNDVVANTGTFGGLLKAAAATITGALSASTVSATTMNANTFIGELQGNAATATKLQTPRTIWGQSFDGTNNCDGLFRNIIEGYNTITFKSLVYPLSAYGIIGRSYTDGSYSFQSQRENNDNETFPLLLNPNGGNIGIGTTSPLYKLDVNGNARIASDLYTDATVGTRNFASHTTGWRADANGNADFRNIYADELRVQAFTADISQALAGSDYLTKSVSKLSANFVVPSVNSTVRIIVDDIEGMPATQCFSNNDYIRFRAFNRTSGLTIANVWGTVTLDTSYGSNGFLNGTQAYTFTCKQTTGTGLTVFKGSEVLDYGISESGLITRTTLDTMGSPYEQIATWKNDPSNGNNYTVHARLGNLNGIANCNGYGLYTDNGFFTGKIVIGDLTKTANYLSFDTVNGLQIKLGGTSVATTTDVNNSLTTANTNAQGYANTAQTNAINTASGDATTKANNAYNSAVTYTNTQISATNNSITAAVSGIQIGGTNILRNTRNWTTTDYWGDNGGGISIDSSITYLGQPTLKTTGPNGLHGSFYRVDENTYYTYSAMLYASADISVDGNTPLHKWVSSSETVAHNEQNQTTNISLIHANTWTLVSVTFLVPSGSFYFRPFVYGFGDGVQINIAYIKCEKGNKATDWTPSPEDVDANIATAQSTAITTAASNAAALYVTQSAYSSQVTILQDSINAKVSQTDFNALGTRVGTAESTITQHSNAIASKVSQTDYTGNTIASLINQTATTIQIQANRINLVGAVTIGAIDKSSVTPSALGAATPTDVSTAVNGIQIGGRNLIIYSRLINGFIDTYGNVYYDSNNMCDPNYYPCKGNQSFAASVHSNPTPNGADVFIVFYDSNKNCLSYVTTFDNGDVITPIFTSPESARYYRYAICYKENICKIEFGNKATDWTPAPEDVDASINGIQIGGRNLFGYNNGISPGYATAFGFDKDNNGFWFDTPQAAICLRLLNLGFNGIGGTFTVSGYIRASSTTTDCYLNLCDYGPVKNGGVPITTSYTYFERTYENVQSYITTDNYNGFLDFENLTAGVRIYLKDFKIERGNKATTYTPAPEDVDASISTAQSTADAALTRNNTMAVKLGYTDYNALASAAALGHTLIDGGKINTVLINATAVVTNGLTANCITANMISAGSITADKIDVNNVSASIANVISLDAGRIKTGILSADRIDVANVVTKGIAAQTINAQNATISNLNVVNANVSGTLNGVSGTFNYLQGVGSNGKFWFDNTFEALSIKDEDFRHLGRKNTRMVRFYASNIRCSGSFGASSLNMAIVHNTYIDYFVNGDTYSYARSNLKPNGVGGYYVPLYPTVDLEYSLFVGGASLGDIVDFPVDLLVFDNSANYHYEMLLGATGKRVTVVNANNNFNDVYLYINGATDWKIVGGKVQTFINIREFTNPLISSSVHGAGWMLCGEYDNTWA